MNPTQVNQQASTIANSWMAKQSNADDIARMGMAQKTPSLLPKLLSTSASKAVSQAGRPSVASQADVAARMKAELFPNTNLAYKFFMKK